mgnify:CR=1 FL=1
MFKTIKRFTFVEKIDMKNYILCFIMLFQLAGNAQNRFTQILPETEYISAENELKNFSIYDFSPVILGLEMNRTYGTIGISYRRIHIKITNVEKDVVNPDVYHVIGKSKVGNNIESFTGTIKLQSIKQINITELDNEPVNPSAKYEGVISGVYQFNEPKDRSHSGVFEGTYQALFQITQDNTVFYNDLGLFSDGYMNNVYQGFWTNYQTKEAKICKWADFRVPDVSGDFDLGAGEFSPNEKYNNKGWQTYNDAYLRKDKSALALEEAVWWE